MDHRSKINPVPVCRMSSISRQASRAGSCCDLLALTYVSGGRCVRQSLAPSQRKDIQEKNVSHQEVVQRGSYVSEKSDIKTVATQNVVTQ